MLKKVNQKGFTIIEVLIVLAIAGVIMLVVFLAVPALQRNSRNTQRTSDASLLVTAVNECLTNKNGVTNACSTLTNLQNTSLDTNKLRQLTTVNVSTAMPASTVDATAGTAWVVFGRKCDVNTTTGVTGTVAGTNRQYVVLYNIETTAGGTTTLQCTEG